MKNILLIIVGSIVIALSISFLGMPNNIADGGLIGIALLLYHAYSFSPAIVNFLGFIIIVLISLRYLSKSVLMKSSLTVVLLSFFTFLTEPYGQALADPLIGAIFYGFFMGIGFALILFAGSSIGGGSTIALVLNKKFGWNVVLFTFISDVVVVLSGIFIIGVLNTLYTIIGLFIGKLTTDYIIGGVDSKKAFNIISPKSSEIAKRVTEELASSATYIKGSGVYSNSEHSILYIIVKNYNVVKLRKIVSEVDSDAFVVVNNVKDVSGGTFFVDKDDKHQGDTETMIEHNEEIKASETTT
ncbi:YitT family protein [Shouchella sp. JSM 1781072]|uniref:YitT family protein n=1 Tax=Bacillaceae TaxID=186817 RepID=UPI00159B922E|nr:YitT family protein [Bacillus sp. Marseille-P3800]